MRNCLKFCVAILLFSSVACNSIPLNIDTGPLLDNERTLGDTFGQGTGLLLFGLIPIGQNDRFERAYAEAVNTFPGATRLTNVSIQEKWFWAYVLTGYKFRVNGTAVGQKQ